MNFENTKLSHPTDQPVVASLVFSAVKSVLLRVGLISGLLILCFLGSKAYGQSFSHDYYYRNRTYFSNIYWNQSIAYDRTQLTANETALPIKDAGGVVPVSQAVRGQSIKSSVGMESFRFLQAGISYQSGQLTGILNPGYTMRLQDIGADAKIVLSTPICNLLVGGGSSFVNLSYANGTSSRDFSGNVGKANVEVSRYVTSRVQLFISGELASGKLKARSLNPEQTLEINSRKLGGGFGFWF